VVWVKTLTQGSNFLIMMIMGGGIVSWLTRYGMQILTYSYLVIIVGVMFCLPRFCYAWRVSGILKAQGINLDEKEAGGH
jgi:MFS transporter, FHS family, L-fucose permease